MARPIRVEYSGAVCHILARGNQGWPICQDDRDRKMWLAALGEARQRTGWRIHAWVLMGNHFHLLLETPWPIRQRVATEGVSCRPTRNRRSSAIRRRTTPTSHIAIGSRTAREGSGCRGHPPPQPQIETPHRRSPPLPPPRAARA
jgi:REP element-mobilizing transposase RayT